MMVELIQIPDLPLSLILSFLNLSELGITSCVSKRFNEIAKKNNHQFKLISELQHITKEQILLARESKEELIDIGN